MGHRWLHWGDAGAGGGGGGGGDPDWATVCLRMPLDGVDGEGDVAPGNVDFSDNGPSPVSFRSSIELDSTAFGAKFGSTCIKGFNQNLDAILMGGGGDDTFNFAGNPFVIEMWGMWLNAADRDHLNSVSWRRRTLMSNILGGGAGGFMFSYKPYVSAPGVIFEWKTTDSQQHALQSGGVVGFGGWNFFTVERGDDDILRIMLNGTVIASTNVSGQVFKYENGQPTTIGQQDNSNSSFWNGAIDDIRVTCGAARYNGSFTAPTEAFPISA